MIKFYMGCDVSKGYADFIIINNEKEIIEKSFQVDDTHEGHIFITDYLKSFFDKHSDSELSVAVESTGGYEDNWYNLFLRLGVLYPIKIARLNPLGVRRCYEASMNRNCTDAIAAKSIALYLISYPEKVVYNQDVDYNRVCRQWSLLELLIKQRTQLLNQLNSLMYQSNPELLPFCKNTMPQWILKLLQRYPTASKLAKAKPKNLIKIEYLSIERATDIIKNAKSSIASHVSEIEEVMVKEIVTQIETLTLSIEKHKKLMGKDCNLKEVKLLCTFKGISYYSAIGLLVGIISISRFPTVKQLASYFGLHPVYRQSGDGIWGNFMSKKGQKKIRTLLFMITLSATVSNPIIKDVYEKSQAKGMTKMAAIGVCMHKIIRVVYGMLKDESEFNPDIDKANREKLFKKGKKKNKVRRFQTYDTKAPISRRQLKKRKEIENDMEPHKKNIPENEVIQSSPILNMVINDSKKQDKYNIESIGEILTKMEL